MRNRLRAVRPFVARARKRVRAAHTATAIEVGGFAAVAFGAFQVYEPAGWVVAGVLAWWAAQGMDGGAE